jgi:hypothetical protein
MKKAAEFAAFAILVSRRNKPPSITYARTPDFRVCWIASDSNSAKRNYAGVLRLEVVVLMAKRCAKVPPLLLTPCIRSARVRAAQQFPRTEGASLEKTR